MKAPSRSEPSKARPGWRRFLLAASLIPCSMSFAGCMTTRVIQAAQVECVTPATVLEKCKAAPLPKSEAGIAGFAVVQTGQLEICDGRRQLAVDALELCKAKQALV